MRVRLLSMHAACSDKYPLPLIHSLWCSGGDERDDASGGDSDSGDDLMSAGGGRDTVMASETLAAAAPSAEVAVAAAAPSAERALAAAAAPSAERALAAAAAPSAERALAAAAAPSAECALGLGLAVQGEAAARSEFLAAVQASMQAAMSTYAAYMLASAHEKARAINAAAEIRCVGGATTLAWFKFLLRYDVYMAVHLTALCNIYQERATICDHHHTRDQLERVKCKNRDRRGEVFAIRGEQCGS